MTDYWTYEYDGDLFGGHYRESERDTQEQAYELAQNELADIAPVWFYLIKYRVTDTLGADDLVYEELERVETFIEGPCKSDLEEHGTWYKGCAI